MNSSARLHKRVRTGVQMLAIALVALLAVLVVRAFPPAHASRPQGPLAALPAFVQADAVARFAAALRFETVALPDGTPMQPAAFDGLHDHLQRSFPLVHAALQRERVGRHGLLYTWPGLDPAAAGVLLMAHLDVVPGAIGDPTRWVHPPFSGTVADGYVWGRGAWDDKGRVLAQLEAVESLLRAGVRPSRTLYLAFGHDEEVGGEQGAARIAGLLRQRGAELAFVLDEGLVVTEGVIAGARRPVALIGVAEKGRISVRLRALAAGGHSSMPPSQTAIGRLSRAVAAVEARPMPARLHGTAAEMFTALAPEMSPLRRLVLANLWLFAPVVQPSLEKLPTTNAMLRTTTAVTVIRGGHAPNVLPLAAEATVNFRLLPGDTAEQVLDHVRRVVDDDAIEVELLPAGQAPSPVSPHDTAAYHAIARSIEDVFGDVAVAPGLVIGGTDARHMSALTPQIYRFSPVRVRADDLPRIHGNNERLAVSNYVEMVRFYQHLLLRSVAAGEPG